MASVTITDIAKHVGVSHPVVSKVLSGGKGTANASETTRQKILEAARELGYRPHAASRALRNQQFRNVGILMGGDGDFYLPQRLMAKLAQCLSVEDYTCTLLCMEQFTADQLLACPLVRDRLVDVLLIGYVYEPPREVVEVINRLGISVIWLNRVAEFDAIYVDEYQAAFDLVEHLAQQGHQRITLVDYSGEGGQNPVYANRMQGIGQAAENNNIEVTYLIHKRLERGNRKQDAKRWLTLPNRSSAVISHSLSAAQVILLAAVEMGLSIPDDLAIASFDHGSSHLITEPAITCAMRPEEAFGQAAAKLALLKAKQPDTPIPSTKLSFTLDICQSTTG
ncbi:MAG: LacI family DNA-binding transcriptional regulator [Phycisphaeraceae bacterium JB051]